MKFQCNVSSLNLLDLSSDEIQSHLKKLPVMIIPIGGLEPIGRKNCLGVINYCTEIISHTLSINLGCIVAPCINYSMTTPFRSFAGSMGMKKRCFTSMLRYVFMDCKSWGVAKLIVIEGSFFGIDNGIQKECISIRDNFPDIRVLNWQHDQQILHFRESMISVPNEYRCESAIHALFDYLLTEKCNATQKQSLVEQTASMQTSVRDFMQWKKRGKDPEKFKKLFPRGLMQHIPDDHVFQRDFGEKLFEYIISSFQKRIEQFMQD